MPLSPEMEFHFDQNWPTGTSSVFMTPNRVWGPLVTATLSMFSTAIMFIKGGGI